MTAMQMIKIIRINSKFEQLPRKIGRWTPSRNKMDSEFILISTIWAKHRQSEIQMVERTSTSASSNNCLHWWREKFASWNKNFVIKYCQYTMTAIFNDQENSHKLQTASSKNRKMNFRLEIKLTVNLSWFRVAMWAQHQQSEIQMVKRNSASASSKQLPSLMGREICFLK